MKTDISRIRGKRENYEADDQADRYNNFFLPRITVVVLRQVNWKMPMPCTHRP